MPFKKYLIKHRQMEIFTGILRKTMANKICGSDEKLKAAEIPQSSTTSNFILNENVNLEDVRRFFKETAWAKFEKIINYKRLCVFSVIFVPLIQQKRVSVKDIYYNIPKLNWKISPPYCYTEQFAFQSF